MKNIDVSTSRKLLQEAISEVFVNQPSQREWLFSSFFTNEFHDQIKISYDQVNMARVKAVATPRGGRGTMITAGTFVEHIFVAPEIQLVLNIEDAMKNYVDLFGAQSIGRSIPYQDVDNALIKLQDLLSNMKDSVRDQIEYWIAQTLTTDSIITEMGDTYLNYRKAASLPALTTAWTNTAADIKGDINNAINFFRSNNLTPEGLNIFLPFGAGDYILKNTAIKADADVRKFENIQILGDVSKKMGFNHVGQINVAGIPVNLLTHMGMYKTSTLGSPVSYLPSNKAVVMPTNYDASGFKIMHSALNLPVLDPSTNLKGKMKVSGQETYLTNTYSEYDHQYQYKLYSSPLPVIKNIDSIYTITIA